MSQIHVYLRCAEPSAAAAAATAAATASQAAAMRQKGGRSKRDRKHKVIQSLKHKHGSQAGLAEASDADLTR